MFWPFGTGKKLPGRILAAMLLALVAHEGAYARPHGLEKSDAFRLRLGGSFGLVQFNELSFASNTRVKFDSFGHLGRRGELEKWLMNPVVPWPVYGVHADVENFPAKFFGRGIHYSATSLSALWRVTGGGYRKNWRRDEIVLGLGASVQVFPDVRAHPGFPKVKSFDYFQPVAIGAKASFKWRHRLSRRWYLDTGIHYIQPLQVTQVGGLIEVDQKLSRSLGGYATVDYTLFKDVDLGFGGIYQYNKIQYTPVGGRKPQSIQWNNATPVVFIQFWFGGWSPYP